MQKVNLITVKEIEVPEGMEYLELRNEKIGPDILMMPNNGPINMTNCVEEYTRVPIQCYMHVDGISVLDRRAENLSPDELIKAGYKVSRENNQYEKTYEDLVAIDPEASKYIEMEKESIEELKYKNKKLQAKIGVEQHNIVVMKEYYENKFNNLWSTKIKRFFGFEKKK